MKIIVGMLVDSVQRREKYSKIIKSLFMYDFVMPKFFCYSDLKELYRDIMINNNRVDILILPASLSNYEFANEFRKIDRNCIIIYPAMDMELVLGAFESMPIAYVVPSEYKNGLIDALIKAANYLNSARQEISFETKSRLLHYSLYNIDYFESQYRIVHIVERSGARESITARLDDVEAQLPKSFFRCHQSFLVNMENIKYVDKTERMIYFNSGQSVPSSKKHFTDFLNALRACEDKLADRRTDSCLI